MLISHKPKRKYFSKSLAHGYHNLLYSQSDSGERAKRNGSSEDTVLRDSRFTAILKHGSLRAKFNSQLYSTIMHLKLVRIATANVRVANSKAD